MADHSSILREVGRSQGEVEVAWYRPEQWAQLLAIAADREKLHARYEDWLASAQRTLLRLNAEGTPAKRVDVDVEQVRGWCEVESRRWMPPRARSSWRCHSSGGTRRDDRPATCNFALKRTARRRRLSAAAAGVRAASPIIVPVAVRPPSTR